MERIGKGNRIIIFALLLIVSLFFSPYSGSPFRASKESILYLLLAIAIFFQLFYWFRVGKIEIKRHPVYIPLICFFVYSLLSITWADDVYSATKTLINILSGILFFFLVNNVVSSKKNIGKILFLILLCGTGNSVFGLFQNFDIDPFFRPEVNILEFEQALKRVKIFGFMGNPNLLSVFLALCIPSALILLLASRKLISQISILLLAAVMISNIYLGQSRNSFFGIIIGLIFFFTFLFYTRSDVFQRKKRNIFVFLVLMVIVLEFLFLFPGLKERIKHESETLKLRKAIWRTTLNMILDRSIAGWGIGCFKTKYYDYHIQQIIYDNYNYGYTPSKDGVVQTHNEYLQILSELGIFGLFFLMWAFIVFLKGALRSLKASHDYFYDLLNIGSITAVVMSGVLSVASFPFHFVPSALLSLLYLCISGFSYRHSSSREPIELKFKSAQGGLGSIFAVVVGLSLFGIAIVSFVAMYYAKAGDVEFVSGRLDDSLSFYKKALALNPYEGEYNFKYASALALKGEYRLALDYLGRARKNFLRPEVDVKTGLCYEKLGMIRLASYYYENAVIYSNDFMKLKIQLGKHFLEMGDEALKSGDFFGSLHLYKKAKRYHPENSDIYVKIAKLYELLGDTETRLHYLEVAYAYNTRDIRILSEIGDIYFNRKEYVKAFMYYMRLRYLMPDDREINFMIDGKYKFVLEMFRKKEPANGFWDFQLFLIARKMNKPREAGLYLEGSIKKKIDVGYAYYLRGNEVYASNSADPWKLYRTAIQYDPTLIDAYYKLWNHYKDTNDLSQIEELRRKLRSITCECRPSRYLSRKKRVRGKIVFDDAQRIIYLGSSYVSEFLYITSQVPYVHLFQKCEKSPTDKADLVLILEDEDRDARIYKFEDRYFVSGTERNMINKITHKLKKEFASEEQRGKENERITLEDIMPSFLLGNNWVVIENNRFVHSTEITTDIIYTDPMGYYLFGYQALGKGGLGSAKVGWMVREGKYMSLTQYYSALPTYRGDARVRKFCSLVDESNANFCELIFNYTTANSGGIFYNIFFIPVVVYDIFYESQVN